MQQVSIARAKAEFATLVAKAEAGEEIIITRNGTPVARVSALGAPDTVAFDDLGYLKIADDLSLPEEVVETFYAGTHD